MKKLPLIVFSLIYSLTTFAGNVKGIIKNTKGETMPYTSVIVKGTSTGTMANAQGEYAIGLQSGTYELVFQFLGYKSLTKEVKIGTADIELNVVLEEQVINLGEVKVGGGAEDPAYTIMRKAIAKSKIHDLQVTSFQAKAYIRNTIQLNKIPFLLRGKVAEAGFKVGVPTVAESVIEISFKQPATRFVKVLARKSSLENFNTPDNLYLINFYKTNPQIISPLSPNAFSVYRFEYEGFFEDRGLTINKIKVIPRGYGEGVWRGEIFIIEDYWNIHSVNLETVTEGLHFKVNQVYAPIQKVWMPITQRIDGYGSIFGFDFAGKAQVNPTYTALQTNPAFVEEIKVIDEKKEDKKQPSLSNKDISGKKIADVMAQQKEFSLKNLKKLMKENEKQEKARLKTEKKDFMAVRNDSVVVDSMATKRSAAFWEEARTIPLSREELKGYKFTDSIKIVKEENRDSLQKDSLRKSWQKFILGHNFKLKNGHPPDPRPYEGVYLKYEPFYTPLFGLNYNTVEGVTSNLGLTLYNTLKRLDRESWRYSISTDLRYSFGRKDFSGKLSTFLSRKSSSFTLSGGKYIAQFDQNSGILHWENTITTLFLEDNLMKIYEKKFVNFGYSFQQDRRFTFSTNIEFANRSQLDNLLNVKPLIDTKKRSFSPNTPLNIELGSADFPTNNAITWNSSINWNPGLRYRIRNGQKIYMSGKLPTFTFTYRKGMEDVNYDFLSLRMKHQFQTGAAGQFDYSVEVGGYPNANKLYLMDMKHINNSFLNAFSGDLFSRFRLLDTRVTLIDETYYDNLYKFSTKNTYVEAHAINEFRRLLITRMPFARIKGWKEDFFINYLNSKTLKNYTELGYGIDGIGRLWRLEFITSFEDGKYIRNGFRVGVTI